MNRIAVIDYGMGNLHSVAKALEYVANDATIEVTSSPEQIRRADRVVLPGVGAIGDCINEIKRLSLDEVIHEVAKSKPFLGVCVGMQALMEKSAENGGTECLGILEGTVEAFGSELMDPVSNGRLKVPHMGWNQVSQNIQHPMWEGIGQDTRFYFVHSFYVQSKTPDPIAGTTVYGFPFVSALAKDNVFAVQFHPEKSHNSGLKLYANFVTWKG